MSSDYFITGPADITAASLSELLDGEVRSVMVTRTGETSSGAYAHVVADGERLFIKWTRPDRYTPRKAEANNREIWFYETLGSLDVHACRCLAGRADDKGASTIILEDLSQTHVPFSAAPPGWEGQCVDALASLHAGFWNDPRLDVLRPQPEPLDAWRERMHKRVEGMAQELALPDTSELHELVDLGIWDEFFVRLERAPKTIQHGDSHSRNYLFGKEGAVLIDWELVGMGVPVIDLMHLLVFDCQPRMNELIERYRQQTPYEKDMFDADWRWALLLAPLLASAFWQNGLRGEVLARRFELAMAAMRHVR